MDSKTMNIFELRFADEDGDEHILFAVCRPEVRHTNRTHDFITGIIEDMKGFLFLSSRFIGSGRLDVDSIPLP